MREMFDVRAFAPARRGRAARRSTTVLLGLAAILLCALPSAASATSPSYVSIGDSYTSGPGIEPYSPTAPANCGQSQLNYPHLVASALKLALTDVSCGGATTADETESQFEGQPPQDDALSGSTEVITIGMGGNDGGLFGTLLNGCTQIDTFEGRPGKAPCKAQYEKFVAETFAADKPAQEAAIDHIKELSPLAKVFVVGYPEITPAHGHCSAFPWYEGDLKWFRSVSKLGNKMIKAGAKAHGATFVDTFKQSIGHNACQPAGTRWVEPLVGSLTGVPAHPNATGEEEVAFAVQRAMLNEGVRP